MKLTFGYGRVLIVSQSSLIDMNDGALYDDIYIYIYAQMKHTIVNKIKIPHHRRCYDTRCWHEHVVVLP